MSTHDYVIANASGSAVRADINNVLAAIVSNNSSSSEPSTKYAYMLWADTTNGILKIRNSANNAWIELLQLDGTLTMEDGAEATPGLAFRDDLNTGIWSSAADTFNISTGGTERLELGAATVFNESGADVDFRIEGDTEANLFYVDAGNDTIGIGTSSPARQLEVNSNTANTFIRIKSSDTGNAGFEFGDQSDTVQAAIYHNSDNNYLIINGYNNAGAIWIDASKNVHVVDGDLKIATNGHGIDFSATGDGSGTDNSELLDEYEEGVFTPSIGGSSNPTQSYVYQRGSYTRIGNVVHATIDIQMSSSGISAGSGSMVLDGLPFNKGSESSGTGSGQTYGVNFTCGYSEQLGSDNPTDGYMADGDDHVYLIKRAANSGGLNCSATAVTNNTRMIAAVTYRV